MKNENEKITYFKINWTMHDISIFKEFTRNLEILHFAVHQELLLPLGEVKWQYLCTENETVLCKT